MDKYKCSLCKIELSENESYEYRGFYSCSDHFDDVIESVDLKRDRIIAVNNAKTDPLKGFDTSSDNAVGKANRKLLSRHIEACGKETLEEKKYREGIL